MFSKIFVVAMVVLGAGFAKADQCMEAAEQAAYDTWYPKRAGGEFGDVAGGTDIVWRRGDITSYQISIRVSKIGSSDTKYSHYSVRAKALANGNCQIVKVRKF
jgi:hypothetical protein